MRLLIAVLIVINLVLFGRLMDWLPSGFGGARDSASFARQVNPEQLKILPAPPGGQTGAPSAAQPGTPDGGANGAPNASPGAQPAPRR